MFTSTLVILRESIRLNIKEVEVQTIHHDVFKKLLEGKQRENKPAWQTHTEIDKQCIMERSRLK